MPFAVASRRWFFLAYFLLIAVLAVQGTPPAGYHLVFGDNFDSLKLDLTGDDPLRPWADCGWNTDTWQQRNYTGIWNYYCSETFVGAGTKPIGLKLHDCSNGTLKLNTYPTPCDRWLNTGGVPFVCGRLTTAKKSTCKSLKFFHGYIEVRARFFLQQGMDSNIGLYSWPHWNEIEITENCGVQRSWLDMRSHVTGGGGWYDSANGQTYYTHYDMADVHPEEWHTYALLWDDSLHFYFDDNVCPNSPGFGSESFCVVPAPGSALPDSFTVQIGTDANCWSSMPDSSVTFPEQVELDYFRYYTKP
jgi:hypothetical protein